MRVVACEGFTHHSVKVVVLAKGDRYEVDSNTFSRVVIPFMHLNSCLVPSLTFLTCIHICSLWAEFFLKHIYQRVHKTMDQVEPVDNCW
jgi:hypothetical protein